MMKNIIVPIDFSEQSEHALKVAASLAKKHGSEILALHMLELNQAMVSSSEGFHPEQTVFLIKLAEKRFSDFLDKPYLKGISITPIVKHFKVFSEVNQVAKKHNANLIVMGSHGTDGLKEIFVGSNAEKVVRNATIPVLVIKDELPDFKVDRFVFACDFRDDNLLAFQKAKDFANMLSAKLDLVYINTPGDNFLSTGDAYDRINQFLRKSNTGMEVEIYNDYTVEKGILNYSEMSSADIIGISTHGRKGLSHFFMGSIGEDLANHSKIPVVTFKINN
jgi:nucleotide-binding universal stress UspA family protein